MRKVVVFLFLLLILSSCVPSHEHDYTYNENLQQCECGEVNPEVCSYVGTDFDHATRRFVSFSDAISYAKSVGNGIVLNLCEDVSSGAISVTGTKMTLDLEGHTLTLTDAQGINIGYNGQLTIVDGNITGGEGVTASLNVNSGTLTTSVDFRGSITVGTSATYMIEGGVVYATSFSPMLQSNQSLTHLKLNGGTLVLANLGLVQNVKGHFSIESSIFPEIAGHAHNFVLDEEGSTAKTCTAGGTYYYDCSCGFRKLVRASADGHQWDENGQGDNCTVCHYNKHFIITGTTTKTLDTDGQVTGEVIIPSYVATIKDNAFEGCTGLTGVTITSNVKTIGEKAFLDCTSLETITIEDGVTTIKLRAFENCTSLEAIVLPDSITSLAKLVFIGCSSLSDITMPYAWGENFSLLFGFDGVPASLTNLNVTIKSGTTAIQNSAFLGAGMLEEITIPDGVLSIGGSAFAACHGLTSVVIPNSVQTIAGSAFSTCRGLESIVLPSGLQTINDHLFANCEKLDGVVLPSGIAAIDHEAFYGCTSLESISIPASVGSIGYSAFDGCTNLETVTVQSGSTMTSIGSRAFYQCSSLTAFTIPTNVVSIGHEAFEGCTGLQGEIVIPSGVTKIEYDTFRACYELTKVHIPVTVTEIGEGAFYTCTGLEEIEFEGTTAQWNGISFGNNWRYSVPNTTVITCLGDSI